MTGRVAWPWPPDRSKQVHDGVLDSRAAVVGSGGPALLDGLEEQQQAKVPHRVRQTVLLVREVQPCRRVRGALEGLAKLCAPADARVADDAPPPCASRA